MRIFKLTALWLVVACALAWPADWTIWRISGSPMQQISVTRFVVAPLKGGKEEYYPDGTETVDCSRSLFFEAGQGACWWVQRHRTVFDR
jgi:hypothetical protein